MTSRLRVFGAIVAVAVVLLGGVLLQGMGDGGASSSANTPAASRTALDGAPTPAASATAGTGYDLGAAEIRGGHTLARHVGRSDAQLIQRLKDEPDISAASTYRDRATAERVVAAAIAKGAAQVASWERGASHPNLALRVTMAEVIGRSVDHGSTKAGDVKSAVVVLAWDAGSWFVLTSYPEAR